MSLTNFPNGLTSFGVPVLPGLLPIGPDSQCFFVDPANGNNANDGLTPQTAVASVATTHYVILRGACQFVGFTGVGDTVTRIYGAGPAPNSGMFLSTAPAG